MAKKYQGEEITKEFLQLVGMEDNQDLLDNLLVTRCGINTYHWLLSKKFYLTEQAKSRPLTRAVKDALFREGFCSILVKTENSTFWKSTRTISTPVSELVHPPLQNTLDWDEYVKTKLGRDLVEFIKSRY